MPWLAISLDKPSISLFRASNLAFSKFKSLPVSNSASNSSEIDSSKFNRDEAIPSTLSNDKPTFLASRAAFVRLPPIPCVDNLIAALAPATSLKITFWLIADLLAALNNLTSPCKFALTSCILCPVASVNVANWADSSALAPKNFCCKANSAPKFWVAVTERPKLSAKLIAEAWASAPVTPLKLLPIELKFLTNCSLSFLVVPNSLLIEDALSSISLTPLTIVATAKASAAFVAAFANSLAPALNAFSPSAEASRAASAAFWNSSKTLLTRGISWTKSFKSSKTLASLDKAGKFQKFFVIYQLYLKKLQYFLFGL